jgi:4-amino-4-deoxy-L-arabinose transferase-like glycosyltransferase
VALVVASALRIPGARYGLPLPLLNPDEENIVPRAWAMADRLGLDPGWYDYPSLLFGLLAPAQLLFDEPSYGAARAVAIAVGLGGVAAAWWLGRVVGGTATALVASLGVAVATTHVAYSRMAVTDVLLTLLVTATLALLVTNRVPLAGAVLGLAISTKYPAVALAVPLVAATWGRWLELARAVALAIAAFALTSPFVVLHAGAAVEDARRVNELARLGWLGLEDSTPFAYVEHVWNALGPVVVVAAAGAVLAFRRRDRTDLLLLAFVGAYALQLLLVEARFDRYVLPLVPPLLVLAGRVRPLVPLTLVLLVVPLVWSVSDTRALAGEDTRLAADRWLAQTVPAGAKVAADPSTVPLARYDATRFELPGPGRPFDGRRDLGVLRRAGVEWIVTGGAVTDRVRARPDLYPREVAFYEALDRAAAPVLDLDADQPGRSGPWIRVHRLTP